MFIFNKLKYKNEHGEVPQVHFPQTKIQKRAWRDLSSSFSAKKISEMIFVKASRIQFRKLQ